MKKYLVIALALGACGGFKKDYDIVDASENSRPKWAAADYVADLNHGNDGWKYFLGENEALASGATKALCRAAAETKARYDFAAAIESNIKAAYREIESAAGESEDVSKNSQVSLDRALVVDKKIGGAEKYKDYWEQRSHKKDLGAAKDYRDYSCQVLIRMKQDLYESAIVQAAENMTTALKAPKEEAKNIAEKAIGAELQ
ncbi:MAG: hypothetical protein LBL46_04765 [Rickettsiales bacterium]|jgi:hypothetical protein|nr:hypothetical protein [Rickettsiales bacterium]